MTTELAERPAQELMPAFSIEAAVERYNAVLKFTQTIMKQGKDYGAIPGTDKPTLLKPGAEKLCSFFGLALDYEEMEKVCDWNGGFFFFTYKAVLSRNGQIVATGIGSSNTKEKKYRWRNADRKCPTCGKETILKSKDKPEFFCWRKKGGCGAVFSDRDPKLTEQTCGKVENTETFDLVNTIQKMAQKRALVAATLVAANASEFYTQDVEDMQMIDGDYSVAVEPQEPPPAPSKPAPPAKVDPQRAAELIALCKAKQVPGDKVAEWLAKAGAESFDDCKAETVEALIKLVGKLPAPKEEKPDVDAHAKFITACREAAMDSGLTENELVKGMEKYTKSNKIGNKGLDINDKQRTEVLALINGQRGFFAPANPTVAEEAAA